MKELKGLATGIGSLPHKDAEAAIDLIFESACAIPFWPQLPKRDVREGMIAQFSEGLPCIKIESGGLNFNPESKDKELEKFYEKIINQDVEYFKISEPFALGLEAFYQRLSRTDLKQIKFIKCQITGPFTFSASIKDENDKALLHDPVLRQAVIKGLAMKALWQIKRFKEFGKIILFIDEPYLGCFGSAYTPINREEVVTGLTELTNEIKKAESVLIGLHCCGNTDWSIFTDIRAIDIISFDAFAFLDKFMLYAKNLEGFLKSKRIICWGIVPTQDFSGKETAEYLVEKINQGIDVMVNKGLDRDLLSENLLVAPSCGLGTLDTGQSERIFKLLSRVSSLIRK